MTYILTMHAIEAPNMYICTIILVSHEEFQHYLIVMISSVIYQSVWREDL